MAGDAVRRALASGATLQEAAQAANLTISAATKARWLAAVYQRGEREQLGQVLARLTPSHLEVAAHAGSDRITLLCRADANHLSVRALRQEVARASDRQPHSSTSVVVFGVRTELERTSEALERYASYSAFQLERLLAGPNGEVVRRLALAGQALSARLTPVSRA